MTASRAASEVSRGRFLARSLFWRFAGAFLAVLLLGFAFQVLIFAWIVGPVLDRELKTEVGAEAERVARVASELLAQDPDAFLGRALLREPDRAALEGRPGRRLSDPIGGDPDIGPRGRPMPNRPHILVVFQDKDGWIHTPIFHRKLPPKNLERILDRPAEFMRPFRGRNSSLGRSLGEEPAGDTLGGQPGGPIEEALRSRRVIEVRRPVVVAGDTLGTAIAIAGVRRPFSIPAGVPRPAVFLLPLAALLAGAAGLWLFRGLISRLKSLEAQAAKVAAGDLTDRVPDLGLDEVGALGRSLNLMTERLRESRELLVAEDLRRRRFLGDVAHELSTPLTSIRGYAETLLNPDMHLSADESESYRRHILEESERMNVLISDLMDLVRLEAEESKLEFTQLDLAQLCRYSVDRFSPQFEKAGLQLAWVGDDSPALILADGRRIEQVIDNLLSNALRYVLSRGEVSVRVGEVADGQVELIIEDNGPGFSEKDIPHLFERFFRGDKSRAEQGTGLGLSIVSEIIQRHGGTVAAENRTEGGARFRVCLPRTSS